MFIHNKNTKVVYNRNIFSKNNKKEAIKTMRSSREIQRIRKEIENEKNNNKRTQGEKGKKTQYVWRAGSGDSCSACLAMDGQIFDSPVSTTLHPNCQCTLEKEEVEVKDQDKQEEQKFEKMDLFKQINPLMNKLKEGYKQTTEIDFLDIIQEIMKMNISDKGISLKQPIKLKEKDDIWNIFVEEYKILRATNAIGNDAHQHALANARATSKYGKSGDILARTISEVREGFDFLKNYEKSIKQRLKEREEDLISNKIGRELGLKYPNATRKELSEKLSEEYGISNKYYRESLQDAINQSRKYKK